MRENCRVVGYTGIRRFFQIKYGFVSRLFNSRATHLACETKRKVHRNISPKHIYELPDNIENKLILHVVHTTPYTHFPNFIIAVSSVLQ